MSRLTVNALALAMLVGTAVLPVLGAGPAHADPNVPCGPSSHLVFDYYNVRYKNCGSAHTRQQPYALGLGYLGECKPVAPGSWVSWTHMPRPAIGKYTTKDC